MSGEPQYAATGIDLAARHQFTAALPELLAQARRPEVLADAGPFSGLFELGLGYRNPVLTASVDGIGTKVKLQKAAGRLDLCGLDIIGHSVDDILACGAEPLFFLDYIAGHGLTNDEKTALVGGVAKACAGVGCALLGGETADMPGVYPPGEFDLAGTIVGIVERDDIIDGKAIQSGNVIVGIPSSGLHTNGYSLARAVFEVGLDETFEETRERLAETPSELGGVSLGDALLATHRAYHTDVLPIRNLINGIAHITGGGYLENLPRVLPDGLAIEIDTSAWDVPGVFRLIEERGEVGKEEMYEVFNMGIGLALFIAAENLDEVLAAISDAVPIGTVNESQGPRVKLVGID